MSHRRGVCGPSPTSRLPGRLTNSEYALGHRDRRRFRCAAEKNSPYYPCKENVVDWAATREHPGAKDAKRVRYENAYHDQTGRTKLHCDAHYRAIRPNTEEKPSKHMKNTTLCCVVCCVYARRGFFMRRYDMTKENWGIGAVESLPVNSGVW